MASFLERMPSPLAKQLRTAAFVRPLDTGEVLVGQGEHGRTLFMVDKGVLEARASGEVVNLCRVGDVVGEMAFLDGEPRSADLVAREPSQVLVWPYEV
ncbi:MAG: cyclic nucleotide-binding domain-containing protein [Myxococcota bacterium]